MTVYVLEVIKMPLGQCYCVRKKILIVARYFNSCYATVELTNVEPIHAAINSLTWRHYLV